MSSETHREPVSDSLMSIYSVTAQLHTNEGQLIWQRASNFLLLNGIIAAALLADLQYARHTLAGLWAAQFITVGGLYYAIFHIVSMRRAWRYHNAYHLLMQQQERAMGLAHVGPASQVDGIVDSESVGRFGRIIDWFVGPLTARRFENFTEVAAFIVYLASG